MNEEEQKAVQKRSKIFALWMSLSSIITVVIFIFAVVQRIERQGLEAENESLKQQVEECMTSAEAATKAANKAMISALEAEN